MQTEHLISTDEFCKHYHVEYSFVASLQKSGLIEITHIEQTAFIDTNRLHELERYIRLHYDLDINLEGIEAVTHLLNRLKSLQDENIMLKNKLSIYENSHEPDIF